MPKEVPQTPDNETPKSVSSHENWFRRNRAMIALVLGIGLGASAHKLSNRLPGIVRWGKNVATDYWAEEPKSIMGARSIHHEAWEPSVCDIREGTFLENNRNISEYCKDNTDSIASSCSMSRKAARIFEISEEIKSNTIFIPCDAMYGDGESEVTKTCDVESKGAKRSELIPGRFESIDDSYLFLLKEFSPEAYAMIKRDILFEDGQDLDGALGMAAGPYGVICGQLTDSSYGRFYSVNMKERLGEANFPEMLAEQDRETLGKFLKNLFVLTHETLGHVVFDMETPESNRSEQPCMENTTVNLLGNELYAYYTEAKMIDFMSQRYPIINELLEEDERAMASIELLMDQTDPCDPLIADLEDEYGSFYNDALGFESRLLFYYRQGLETGDWRAFKEYVVQNMSPFWQWAETKYRLEYGKHNGEMEKYEELSKKFTRIMGSNSPDKFLKE